MAEIYLDPKGFQGQIDSFETVAAGIKELKYSLDKQGVKLRSIDRYVECAEAFNDTIALFGAMLDKDTESMKRIKLSWMHVDEDSSLKPVIDVILGK